jgi:hypothetical protein
MKKPKLDRGPKLSSAIAQPQMMMTSGVRQGVPEAGRRSSAITAIDFPQYESAPGIPELQHYRELMHLHGKPKGWVGKIIAAGQPCKIGECNLNKPDECNF